MGSGLPDARRAPPRARGKAAAPRVPGNALDTLSEKPDTLGCCRFARERRTAHSVWRPAPAQRCSVAQAEAGPVLR